MYDQKILNSVDRKLSRQEYALIELNQQLTEENTRLIQVIECEELVNNINLRLALEYTMIIQNKWWFKLFTWLDNFRPSTECVKTTEL